MSQVSRRWLTPNVEAKINHLLIECIAGCADQQAAANFVDVLLTKTERTMIAKRVAIALMLVKGHSADDIDEKLKVSVATVYTVKAWLDSKGAEYRTLLEKIARKDEGQQKEQERLKDEATSFFALRPKANWREQRREQWKRVNDKNVPF